MHSLGPGERRAFKAAGVGDKCAAQVRTGANFARKDAFTPGRAHATPAYMRVWARTFTPKRTAAALSII